MPAGEIKLKAPAKLNLRLNILGRHASGYHELESLMCPISLYDELTLKLTPRAGIKLEVSDTLGQGVPVDADNLAYRAAQLFFNSAGIAPGVQIKLIKRIPAGAGLGGGSSNAAAVLGGLNKLHGAPFTRAALMDLGFTLGADVPFFLMGGPALAKGFGEKLTPWRGDFKLAAVVLFPGIIVSTAKIYQNFKLALTNTPKNSICLSAKNTTAWPNLGFSPCNDLEPGAFELFPEIAAAKNTLVNAGLKHVLMSGSGSAVFGLCHNANEAQLIVAKLKIKSGWRVFNVEILNKFDIVL